MSKAVLIIDMPESCSKCQFIYEFQGIKKCQLMNVLYKGASMLSQHNFTIHRHDKCPLRELPEKVPKDGQECFGELKYMEGWNDCVKVIGDEGSGEEI